MLLVPLKEEVHLSAAWRTMKNLLGMQMIPYLWIEDYTEAYQHTENVHFLKYWDRIGETSYVVMVCIGLCSFCRAYIHSG